jgi:hypothetical protein
VVILLNPTIMFNKITVEVHNTNTDRGLYSLDELFKLDDYLTQVFLTLPFKPMLKEKLCFLTSDSLGRLVPEEDLITVTISGIVHNLSNQETLITVQL